jgi:hypothetical protein
LTTAIALGLAGTLPGAYKLVAAVFALLGAVLLSLQPE